MLNGMDGCLEDFGNVVVIVELKLMFVNNVSFGWKIMVVFDQIL